MVGQPAQALHQCCNFLASDAHARSEKPAIALDDAGEFLRRVKARGGGAMPMLRVRGRAEHRPQTVAPGTHAPFRVLPVERVVAAAGREVMAQRRGAKQRGTAAAAKMRAGHSVGGDFGVVQMNACAVGVPVDEARFLAAAIGAALKDLRADREDVRRAQGKKQRQRIRRQAHVVVEQERAVVAGTGEATLDRARKTKWRVRLNPLDARISRRELGILRERRAIDDHDHLPRFVDACQRDLQ